MRAGQAQSSRPVRQADGNPATRFRQERCPGVASLRSDHDPGSRSVKDGGQLPQRAQNRVPDQDGGLIAAGSAVPNAQANKKWIEPFGTHDRQVRASAALYLLVDPRAGLRHGGAAAYSGALLYQSGRTLRQAHDALGHGADRDLLPVPADLGRHRAQHPADPLCQQHDRQRGAQTADGR